MKIIVAEAITTEMIRDDSDNELCQARLLAENSEKSKIIRKLFLNESISAFLKITELLNHYLQNETPFIVVTDWTDPTEMVGLRLHENGKVNDYPHLCFLAFNTDWEDIDNSGIGEIFSHEISHLWLHLLGFDFSLSKSNKFHTCTAITDYFMAFSEGFAEHLEIVSKELSEAIDDNDSFWDSGYDLDTWLSRRDEQLRYHGVINNRFIYHTAYPYSEDWDNYNNLHLAHITSSAFTPEKVKSGSQMLSSEGVISSIFYQIYKRVIFKNSFADNDFYHRFGVDKKDVSPMQNLYLKILFVLSKIDLSNPFIMTNFIEKYAEIFPDEKEEIFHLFLEITNFATVSNESADKFGNLYRIGKRGEIESFKATLFQIRKWRKDILEKVINQKIKLNKTLQKEIWIDSDKKITSIPWQPQQKEEYRFNVNTATEIDLLSLFGITLSTAEKLCKKRESQGGFATNDDFFSLFERIVYNNHKKSNNIEGAK